MYIRVCDSIYMLWAITYCRKKVFLNTWKLWRCNGLFNNSLLKLISLPESVWRARNTSIRYLWSFSRDSKSYVCLSDALILYIYLYSAACNMWLKYLSTLRKSNTKVWLESLHVKYSQVLLCVERVVLAAFYHKIVYFNPT